MKSVQAGKALRRALSPQAKCFDCKHIFMPLVLDKVEACPRCNITQRVHSVDIHDSLEKIHQTYLSSDASREQLFAQVASHAYLSIVRVRIG
jgi:hypothetical protein